MSSYIDVTMVLNVDSVTLLKTKEAVDNSRAVTEAKYKCFETRLNFESEW